MLCSVVFGQITPETTNVQSQENKRIENSEELSSPSQVVRVFVLAGQSNMQGQGKIAGGSTGAIGALITSFTPSCTELGTETCEFTFNMLDGYGDGWNGWTYDFVQDGEVVATETLEFGSEGTATVILQDGVECQIVVNSAGAYAAEISWTITNSFDEVQASMTGQEDSYPSPNTLTDVMENDDDDEWSILQTDDEWSVFENAFLYFENGQGDLIRDNVTVGQGVRPERIGPELMFAAEMDEYYDDPILIIKAAWGGLSLGEDFRPPSAGGTVGPYYTEMIEMVEFVTENIETEFPELGDVETELTGFAWFQGWNDAGSEDFLNEYESNLYHLVNDVRDAFGNPSLPFVIASAGQGGYEPQTGWTLDIQEIVAVAQENVGCNDTLYGGTVGFVDTKQFYMDELESPDDEGFHYNNNALTFLNVGKSIGEEMILAINNMAYCDGFVSVEDQVDTRNSISVYPNPTSDFLTIDLGEINSLNSTIRLYDLSGKIALEKPSQSNQLIDVSGLAKGMYVITFATAGEVFQSQIVLE